MKKDMVIRALQEKLQKYQITSLEVLVDFFKIEYKTQRELYELLNKFCVTIDTPNEFSTQDVIQLVFRIQNV